MSINPTAVLHASLKQKYEDLVPAPETMKCRSDDASTGVSSTLELRQNVMQLKQSTKIESSLVERSCYFEQNLDSSWFGICMISSIEKGHSISISFENLMRVSTLNVAEICANNPKNELEKILKGKKT